jgi:hypothetical protein
MTGGSEIDQWEPVGLETLQTGDPDGLLYLRARHRCLTDRHHVGLYGPDGRPVRGDDWAKATGAADWSLGSDGRFQAGKEPFGLAAAQNATPAPDCPYLTELQRWNPIDWQHLVRRVGTSISLAWLDHDPIARRELMLAAELGRMAMWEGPGGSLAGDLGFVSAHSGKGCAWGRGQGWILHTAAAAAQLNGPARLQRWGAWFEGVGTVADTGVTPTGCLQGNGFGKPAHGAPFLDRYRVTQSFEHAILANGLYGVAQTVYDAPGLMAAVLSMARQGVCEFLWWDGSNSTYKITAIGPNDISLPVFTLTDPRINDGFKDGWQVASALAFSLDADRTHALTEKRVKDYCNGASDPLKYLLGRNRENLGNRAPLIAVLQR